MKIGFSEKIYPKFIKDFEKERFLIIFLFKTVPFRKNGADTPIYATQPNTATILNI